MTDQKQTIDLPPLPEQACWGLGMHGTIVIGVSNAEKNMGYSPGCSVQLFTGEQVRSCILADRASRPPAVAQQAEPAKVSSLADDAYNIFEIKESADILQGFVRHVLAMQQPSPSPQVAGASEGLTDEEIDSQTRHIYDRGYPVSREYRIALWRLGETYALTQAKQENSK